MSCQDCPVLGYVRCCQDCPVGVCLFACPVMAELDPSLCRDPATPATPRELNFDD